MKVKPYYGQMAFYHSVLHQLGIIQDSATVATLRHSESSEDHSMLLSPLCTLISESNMAIRLSFDESLPFPMMETGVENSQEIESNSIDRPDECSGQTQNPSSLVLPPCTSLAENSTALEPSTSVVSVQDNYAQRSSSPSTKKSTLGEITGLQPWASIQVSSN